MRTAISRCLCAAALAAGCLIPRQARAQAVPATPWDLKLGFTYLSTSGNTETSSASADAAFNRAWADWSVEASASGVSASKQRRRAAESYNAQARAKRKLRQRLQITLGLRWERNRFAGLDSRHAADVSLLWSIRETASFKLRALGGLSAGREDPRGDRPMADEIGGLVQVSADARLSETSLWDGEVTFFPDFGDLEDYRLHGRLGLQAALNRHLALRLGYDFKFDHQPVPGFGTTDTATTASLVLQLGRKSPP